MKKRIEINLCEDCGICCLDTEMILSENDISVILNRFKLEYKREDIVETNLDGFFQLKNIERHCIFLDIDSKLCKIYDIRPDGCKFYPLIYDIEIKNCKYDKDCPRFKKFRISTNKLEKERCRKLKSFIEKELNVS